MFGLSDADVGVICRATPKHDYYVVSERGRRLFWLSPGPVLRAFAGASSKEALTRTEALEAEFGPEWPEHWLRENEVS